MKDALKFEQLKQLFYPKHIAFVGASESSRLGSMLYLKAFKDSKWKDTFYPVNPKYDKIMDWKCYSSVLEIPFNVDTCYISVKTPIIPTIVEECVEKEIEWVIIFSSGFSETGDLEGKKLEKKLIELIKNSNTRIIGPNCLGPFNAETGMAFSFASPFGKPGYVSFMSQSGGHLSKLLDVGYKRDIRFNYGVSFGNQIDLNCVDFINFYRKDPKTKVIAAYLESFGSAYGHDFFQELLKTTKEKPVILWKGGYTQEGERAAFSHTGALGSNIRLWKTMATQTGTTLVKDNEEWWNTIKTFELLFPNKVPRGRNVAIITPGGGSSVNFTDLLNYHGLKIPELSKETQECISDILPKVNVNTKNPIDLGASGFIVDVFINCIKAVAKDPKIDIILLPLWQQHIFRYVFKRMISAIEKSEKPYAFVIPSIGEDVELSTKFSKAKKLIHKKRAMYYLNLRDAALSLSHLCDYVEFLRAHGYKNF
jgi:acetate---CoA ligase (ADP-forming)